MHPFRILIKTSLVGLAIAASAELAARFFFGLGNPPLLIANAKIEYLFRPNQSLRRFGNRIFINDYGMRSEHLSTVLRPGERRVLVFGDSVVFGGAQLDQALIATEQLKTRMHQAGEVVSIGNVSAGSWGPGNWKGWAETFGFLGASDVVLVISSHDVADNPTYAPLSPLSHPQHNPPLALWELVSRYLNSGRVQYQIQSWGLLQKSGSNQSPPTLRSIHLNDDELSEAAIRQGLSDLRAFLKAAQRSGARVSVVQFWERQELLSGQAKPGRSQIALLLQELKIPAVQSRLFFLSCSSNPSVDLYVDNIHPFTPAGQACLADAIQAALQKAKI